MQLPLAHASEHGFYTQYVIRQCNVFEYWRYTFWYSRTTVSCFIDSTLSMVHVACIFVSQSFIPVKQQRILASKPAAMSASCSFLLIRAGCLSSHEGSVWVSVGTGSTSQRLIIVRSGLMLDCSHTVVIHTFLLATVPQSQLQRHLVNNTQQSLSFFENDSSNLLFSL